jgi:uncharacterized phage protein (TIGR01671 family)
MTGEDLFEILMTDDRFRFRAWDNKENKYIYDAQHQYDNEVECFGYMLDDTYKGRYLVEQCTGLKDKNGKLIYEGDIVAVILANGELEDIGCVKYGYFNCSCCDGVYGWGFGDADIRNYDRYTIVGNIHENTEMIDEDNRD